MSTECGRYNQTFYNRTEYVERKMTELLSHFHVAKQSRENFLSNQKIRSLRIALMKDDLSLNKMLSLLGPSFQNEWTTPPQDNRNKNERLVRC